MSDIVQSDRRLGLVRQYLPICSYVFLSPSRNKLIANVRYPVTHSVISQRQSTTVIDVPSFAIVLTLSNAWIGALPKTTAPTVKHTKEKATIKMNNCIDSNGEVSTTKKKSKSNADNVPVSVSEEEEAQMELEDEEKDSKAVSTLTIEGEVPWVSPPVDEEDNDNKEDNNDNDNDEEDDNDDDGDKEDDDDDDDKEHDDDDDNEEDIFDFDLNDIKDMP